jgi:hypothetical protein
MSAATRILRELAEEGVELSRAAVRWVEERFGSAADTPENVARVRNALSRVEPNVPPRPQARDFAAPARPQATAQRRAPERPLAARPQRPLAARPEQVAEQPPPALPPPAEPLPDYAAKPRGGQWWTADSPFGGVLDPQGAVRDGVYLTERFQTGNPEAQALAQWWDRALPRYIQNDLATPDDPLRTLAPLAGMAQDEHQWSGLARQAVIPMPLQKLLYSGEISPNDGGLRRQALASMPWLERAPATDVVYGVNPTELGALNFSHVADELRNAMRPEVSGIPADLAVRPESLQRMSFPQAVERVGRINQWRAAQQAEASLAAQNNPALRTYREYAENNPRGLRWVEIAPPEFPEGYSARDGVVYSGEFENGPEWGAGDPRRPLLQDALRYEGDTMGHCVGGYCDDVLSGRSRIFSLRDARGEPHVTVEARPGRPRTALSEIPRDALDQITEAATADTNAVAGPMGISPDDPRWIRTYQTNLGLKQREWLSANPTPDDIVQIKGKQNRAPNDEYLPFVQDFVRQGQWGNVGDLGNTGLTRLPDGRYITQQQFDEGFGRVRESHPGMHDMDFWYDVRDNPQAWAGYAPYFEGYAVGGRVNPERCFCRHPLSAKR